MRYVLLTGLLLSCAPSSGDPDGNATGENATESASGPMSSSGIDPHATSTGGDAPTTTTGSPPLPPQESSTSGETESTGFGDACDPAGPVWCSGTYYACGDGEDNDEDGLFDLDDPDCLGPCDDDESEFGLGIPDIYKGCGMDCAFDGNGGMGDDGCYHDLRCDPLDPGNDVACQYTGGDGCPPEGGDPEACAGACEPFTLNGCDCFGCCTLDVDGELRDVYLAVPECSAANPDACPSCTQQLEICGNPCEQCEICFGETTSDCEAVECGDATPCDSSCDCADDGYCIQGCCHPAARG